MLSFNAAYERFTPPYASLSYRADQGSPPERAGTRHNGAARAVFERSGREWRWSIFTTFCRKVKLEARLKIYFLVYF